MPMSQDIHERQQTTEASTDDASTPSIHPSIHSSSTYTDLRRTIGFGLKPKMEIAFLLSLVVVLKLVNGRTLGSDSCACTTEWNLVCGSDGVNYHNPCRARCSRASIVHQSRCRLKVRQFPPADRPTSLGKSDLCVCKDIANPVCGVDGTTYGNTCEAACSGVRVWHDGPCEVQYRRRLATSSSSDCSCNKSLLRVCGSDGVTYDNPDCATRCGNITDYAIGACSDVCSCTREQDSVCHVITGTKYVNRCFAECLGADSTQLESCNEDVV